MSTANLLSAIETQRLIPDEEIDRVHANANFGGMSKRSVVDDGVLKYAFGYSTGSTQRAILLEHGLIRVRDPMKDGELTAKGRHYMRALRSMVFGTLHDSGWP